MFDLHLLHLPPLNLLNVNLYYTYTWQERLARESSRDVCVGKDARDTSREAERVLRARGRMKEILGGRG